MMMMKFLQRLFGRVPLRRPTEAVPAIQVAEQVSAATQTSSRNTTFVCREAVLERNQRIAGYRFLLPHNVRARLLGKAAGLRLAYDDALIQNLGLPGMRDLLGNRLVLLGLSPDSLDNPQLRTLSATNTVLLLDPDQALQPPQGLSQRVQALQQLGFKVGYPLRPRADLDAIAEQFDFIQISTPAYDGIEITEAARHLRQARAQTLALIATEVESADDFHLCLRAGIDYFQGPFIHRGENLAAPRGHVDRALISRVLAQLRSGADGKVLAGTLSQDAVMTYKLLRYINSPANGLSSQITSIEQCLLLLGRERFYRWLSLLLFDVQSAGYAERAITERALVRASLMERAGRRTRAPGADPDLLFLTGLFSLLGTLFNQSLEQVLSSISVAPAVNAALLHGTGPLAPLLKLAVAAEAGLQEEIAAQAAACRLNAATLNELSLEALAWANAIGALSEP